ncbi:ubiquitin carboxyl-terminal hydrolase 7 isoform X1 [Brachionus plicatilis]|uniref:Ubiquitin carboxyl-terminal hydrolase 7 isoform X1 n=1 Tax=Brachionus plicatilis TaxID=10195 RepID=A0A3M7STW9_BRAPC|nr:ubiquitin carboxyl-terminal hydrolase 7 isoform X1 [Brachionus plicatilis]
MDGVNIILPCGFTAKYKDVFYRNGKFPCPVCKSHDMTSQECMKMDRNKLTLIEKTCELKKNHYEELMIKFEDYKNDPKFYIDESFDFLKREIDLRREEIKLMLNKQIDDYHDGLLEKIDIERDLKLKVIEKRIQNTDTFDLASFKIDENLNIHSKLEFYKKSEIKIDDGIRSVTTIIDDLKNLKFKLTESSVNIDIRKLFGELDWKEKANTLQKSNHIDKLDNLSIYLPCGFSVKYKDVFYSNGKFPCPVCKSHDMTSQECMKMDRNKLILIEKTCELKKNHYEELMIKLEDYKNDPKYYIDVSFGCLKRQIEHRREEVKAMIDDYNDGLLEKIDMEKDLKLKEFEERIKNTNELDFIKLDVDLNLDTESKIDLYQKNRKNIDNGISLVQNILDDFQEPNFKLIVDDDIDIEKLFGELVSKDETIIILNEDEIDDDSRAEATIQLTINNFSLLKDKNVDLYSKDCIVRNIKWCIAIDLNDDYGWMGFYLYREFGILSEESNIFSRMNEVDIILTCGFSSKFKDIAYINDNFTCPVCKSHEISLDECLNMNRNKLVLLQKSVQTKMDGFFERTKNAQLYKNNTEYHMDKCYEKLKNEIDVRREELKEFEQTFDKIKSLEKEIKNFKIEDNAKINDQIEMNRDLRNKIVGGIDLLENLEETVKESYYGLQNYDGNIMVIDIADLFGELYLRKKINTILYKNNLEIDDFKRSEATIQFVIYDFDKLKNQNQTSKTCILRNLEWSILAKEITENNEKNYLEFYLCCNSKGELKELSVNVDVELRILHINHPYKDLIRNFKQLFTIDLTTWGYRSFLTTKEIMNPISGYFDAKYNYITLQAYLKVDIPRLTLKNSNF